MTHEASWEDLAAELKTHQAAGPLRADWYAYVGSENYGIWFFGMVDRATEEICAAFGLFAARVIEKLGIQPIPTPQSLEHFPSWKLYCKVEEEIARLQGKTIDLSDKVPYGLGAADGDAVDPCTRAWLELLRRESRAFQSLGGGALTIKGVDKLYPSLSGYIPDVWAASAVYCMQRATDEIGTRLINNAVPTGRTLAKNTAGSPEAIAAPPASGLEAQEYQRRDEAARGQRDADRPKFVRQPKPLNAREQREKVWPYPKQLYHDGGSYRVVWSPEEHAEATSEGWSDTPEKGKEYIVWTADEPAPEKMPECADQGGARAGEDRTEEPTLVGDTQFWRQRRDDFREYGAGEHQTLAASWMSITNKWTFSGSKESERNFKALATLAARGLAGIHRDEPWLVWLDTLRREKRNYSEAPVSAGYYQHVLDDPEKAGIDPPVIPGVFHPSVEQSERGGQWEFRGVSGTITRLFEASANLCLELEVKAVTLQTRSGQISAVRHTTNEVDTPVLMQARKTKRAELVAASRARWRPVAKRTVPFAWIHKAAGVDHKDAYNWKNGILSETSTMAKSIERILQQPNPPAAPVAE